MSELNDKWDFNYKQLLQRFYHKYLKENKYIFFSMQVLHMLAALLVLIPPLILKTVIDEAIPSGQLPEIFTLVGWALLVFIVEAIVRNIKTYYGHRVAQKITRDMRNDLYNHYQELSLKFHDNKKTGELMSRIIDDLNRLQEFVHHGPEAIVGSLVLLVGTTAILFSLSVKLTLVALIFVPVLLAFSYIIMSRMHRAFRRTREAKADMNDRLEDNLAGIKVIKAFANEGFEMGRFSETNEEHTRSRMSAIRYVSILFPGSRLLNAFGILAVISYGGVLAANGDMTVGTIVAFYGYLMQFRAPLLQMVHMTEGLSRFFASMERFFSHLELKPEIKSRSGSVDRDRLRGEVEFKNVYFSYNREEEVLSNISFKAEADQTVALVGPSGAGKTSVVRLIPRLYEIDHGQVLIDGIDVRDYRIDRLRNNIAMVMQDDYLFSDSIAENIAYSKPEASMEEIIEVAREANAHQFIKEMPRGYETLVGQRGVKLSGGQRQRISIARAFLKDPRILILDEATSSVDLETEKLIQEAIDRVTEGRTTFIIAHRLATIVNSDRILFIEKGRIMESGTHGELVSRDSKYKQFYRMQFDASEDAV
ncbi:MAG: ABC transporter ATP-binding protein [Bacillota bacterium]